MSLPTTMLADINARMHEGSCPTAGSLGECPIISGIRAGLFQAVLYIWDKDFNDSTAVAGWFRELGANNVTIALTLYSDDNGDRDGKTIDGSREWTVMFTMADQAKS